MAAIQDLVLTFCPKMRCIPKQTETLFSDYFILFQFNLGFEVHRHFLKKILKAIHSFA